MAPTIPTIEPERFTAGDLVKWTKDLSDYPSDTWTLSYSFVKDGAQFDETTSEANGSGHLVTITAAESANITAGTYRWQSYATSGSERYQVGSGTVEVLPNYATETSGYDGRSHVKTVLDALEAVLEGKATADQESVSIAGRSLSKYSIGELTVWRDKYRKEYRREVRDEKLRNGLAPGRAVRTRF